MFSADVHILCILHLVDKNSKVDTTKEYQMECRQVRIFWISLASKDLLGSWVEVSILGSFYCFCLFSYVLHLFCYSRVVWLWGSVWWTLPVVVLVWAFKDHFCKITILLMNSFILFVSQLTSTGCFTFSDRVFNSLKLDITDDLQPGKLLRSTAYSCIISQSVILDNFWMTFDCNL